jgi:hypothetical protein
MQPTNLQTLIIIVLFAVYYLATILRRTAERKIDLYDLIMLSALAILPVLFAFFPLTMMNLSHRLGVAFPFVLMFGLLFAMVFIFLHRLTLRVYKLEMENRLLNQELSLLLHKVKK